MSNDQRRKVYVDATVQGAILKQAILYWLGASLTYAGVVCVFRIIPHWMSGQALDGAAIWYYFAPMAVSSSIFLPMVCSRAVKFSHRFVGPVVRFRNCIQQLTKGERMRRIQLREGDFWVDIAEDLNVLADQIEGNHEAPAITASESREEVAELVPQ